MVVAAGGKTVKLDIGTVDSAGELHSRSLRIADLHALKNPFHQDVAVVNVRAVNEPLLGGTRPRR